MTNLERIKQMNAEELAEVILNSCDYCIHASNRHCCLDGTISCNKSVQAWLESEAEK
jgi:hypothetical protein